MITGEIKSKVDRIWDTMWSGGISKPLSVRDSLLVRSSFLHTSGQARNV